MSYHKCTRKEDLIHVLNEIGEQVSSKETIVELKTKLENSKLFKDDPEFVLSLINLSIEDRQSNAEQQLQITNSQLEIEKIKLQQIEREIELQKAKAEGNMTQKSLQGETNYLENLIKNVIVYDILLIATLDSGANSVIINEKYVSAKKSAFSNHPNQLFWRTENCKRFRIYDLIERGKTKTILSAVCEIEAEVILPLKVYEFLKSESEEARSNDRIRNPVCLEDGIMREQQIDESGCLVNSERIMDKSNLFLLKVSEAKRGMFILFIAYLE
ncbi:hypothetical protein TNCT_351201 [Trichonephila clavata]|uniref:Uncharacterized protein n=1 Tax=Trichonephila clavata TaxID=2740835 RepID=A0A8X6LCU8_TRICU|nr:hypothetical protein TNCT_351201 [Trichonephila clavata]